MKDEEMRKTVGNKLKALRKQKRLTQKELAASLNISISQLNKYESGMHMPPIKKLIQLSNIFDTTLDYLVQDRETTITELHNNKFIKRFKELEHFDIAEQDTVLKVLDAMIMKNKMTGIMAMDINQ